MQKLFVLFFLGFSAYSNALTIDFSSNGGGFVSSGTPAWSYTGASWDSPGSTVSAENFLTSPDFEVSADGDVSIGLLHAYDFEEPGDFFDGGLFEASINGSVFSIITPIAGYPVSPVDDCDEFGFIPCWSGDSGGFVTDILELSSLSAGDIIAVRLHAAWDSSIAEPSPNWQVGSLEIGNVVSPSAIPVPASVLLLGLGLVGIRHQARRKRPML